MLGAQSKANILQRSDSPTHHPANCSSLKKGTELHSAEGRRLHAKGGRHPSLHMRALRVTAPPRNQSSVRVSRETPGPANGGAPNERHPPSRSEPEQKGFLSIQGSCRRGTHVPGAPPSALCGPGAAACAARPVPAIMTVSQQSLASCRQNRCATCLVGSSAILHTLLRAAAVRRPHTIPAHQAVAKNLPREKQPYAGRRPRTPCGARPGSKCAVPRQVAVPGASWDWGGGPGPREPQRSV